MPYPPRPATPGPPRPAPPVPPPSPGRTHSPSPPSSPSRSPNDNLLHYKRELIQSLAFPGMQDGPRSLKDALLDTFQRILDPRHPGGFGQWLASGNGIFWVCGKHGIGKTTFMKCIIQDPQTHRLLASWSRPKPCVVLSYFFRHHGHALQKSPEGLLRTLIFQILSHNRELVEIAFPSIVAKPSRNTNHVWKLDELVMAFNNTTGDDKNPLHICIFVDGLDEYDGDQMSLVQLLQSISSRPCIKMCVASRLWDVFADAFGNGTQNMQLGDVIEELSDMSDMVDNFPNTSSTNFSHAESVFSDAAGLTSATSNTASIFVKPAREVLVESLLEDVELFPLLASAATNPSIGRDRLARNFRRLLDSYARDLRHVAESYIQREAAKFVQHNSAYISDAVRARLVPPKGPNISHPHIETTDAEQKEVAEERLNNYLEETQKSSFSDEDQIPPLTIDTASLLEDDTDYDEEGISNALTQVKNFLGCGSPFENFRKELRAFVEPQKNKEKRLAKSSSKTDVECPMPREENTRQPEVVTSTYISRTGSQVGFQSLPILVDRVFDLFLPLEEPPVPNVKKRVRWRCKCGTRLFDDYIELKPGAIEELESELQQHASAGRLEALMQQGKQLVMTIKMGLWNLIKDPAGLPFTNTQANQNNTQAIHNNAQANQNNSPNASSNLRLLLCMEKGDFQTNLQQKVIDGYSNDKDVFRFLHREYHDHRKFKTWFTLRGIARLSLTRFKVDLSRYAEVHNHSDICGSSCFCLPPKDKIDTEYRCDPAPKVDLGYSPAISTNRLTHYFRSPECVDDRQTTIFAQLPKRTCGELLALGADEPLGWGIHFQEGWHWRTIYVIAIVFLFCFSLIFGIAWSVSKADIQGAFAISSFWLTLGSILFGYLATRSG